MNPQIPADSGLEKGLGVTERRPPSLKLDSTRFSLQTKQSHMQDGSQMCRADVKHLACAHPQKRMLRVLVAQYQHT